MSIIQKNILIGSILGDGNLALYGRSINAYYREHGSPSQNEYRKWKAKILDMKYTEERNLIRSKSQPKYTRLYEIFYINGRKTLTYENIQLLNHPIGLMCLYFDDGSLVIDTYKRKNGIHAFPRIYLYTQSFSREENIVLIEHIRNVFKIEFKLKKIPNGSGWCLELNKRNSITLFLGLIEPFSKSIPCMEYKVNLAKRLNDYRIHNPSVIIDAQKTSDPSYSDDDTELIKKMYKEGVTQKEISNILKRSYYGVVDKIRRMKKEGLL